MAVSGVGQQSIGGDFFSILTLPFRILAKVIVWIVTLILKIILFPLTLVKSVLAWGWDRRPEFYIQNLFHSFTGFLCFFSIVLVVLTVMLLVLIPLHIIPLVVVHRVLEHFDLAHGLTVMGKTFAATEGALIGIAVGGFLLSLLLAFVFVTLYSSAQVFVEFAGRLAERRIMSIVMFCVAVMILAMLYLIVKGVIPI